MTDDSDEPEQPTDAEPTELEKALAEQERRAQAMTEAMPHLPFGHAADPDDRECD